MVTEVAAWRAGRDPSLVDACLADLRRAATDGTNVMPPTIALARAGGTTGEWAGVLREVFGEYRAPTGVSRRRRPSRRRARRGRRPGHGCCPVGRRDSSSPNRGWTDTRTAPSRSLSPHATPGWRSIYSGIRLTPEQIAASARDEDPDVVGLSILSGSHLALVPDVLARLRAAGVEAPVIVGGIIPDDDAAVLLQLGISAVYTPKDYALGPIMSEIADLAVAHRAD